MELNDKQRKMQERIATAGRNANDAAGRYARLKALCTHVYAESEHGSAYCVVCDDRGGWYCHGSPTHLCQYTRDFDCCDFCQQPEERK